MIAEEHTSFFRPLTLPNILVGCGTGLQGHADGSDFSCYMCSRCSSRKTSFRHLNPCAEQVPSGCLPVNLRDEFRPDGSMKVSAAPH